MVTFTRILCPVDFSESSRHALDCAVGVARRYGAAITALHVVPPITAPLPPTGEGLYPPIIFSEQDLPQFGDELKSFAGVQEVPALTTQVVQGSVVGEILRFARELPADLIVMGTHGRSGVERLLLGSVTEKILRKSPCPVLTVPVHGTAAPAVSRVLCAIDFSPASLRALALAQSLAGEAAARLTVVHVLEPLSVFEPVPAMASGEPSAATDRQREVRRRITGLIDSDTRAFSDVAEVVVSGRAYQEILRLAGEQHSDLIVIGAHGGNAGLPAFGSTTNHVVRGASCAVLTVRA